MAGIKRSIAEFFQKLLPQAAARGGGIVRKASAAFILVLVGFIITIAGLLFVEVPPFTVIVVASLVVLSFVGYFCWFIMLRDFTKENPIPALYDADDLLLLLKESRKGDQDLPTSLKEYLLPPKVEKASSGTEERGECP